MSLLQKYIRTILRESKASDAFEFSIADSINTSGPGVVASRPTVGTQYSDIYVEVEGVGATWVEVKMSHSDNLSNPRVFYNGSAWDTTYETPTAKYAVSLLNASSEASTFIREISEFSGITSPILPTTLGGLKNPDAVPLEIMREFVEERGTRYIATEKDVDIGALVTQHYTVGKAAPADYMQAGDDFYLIGSSDPLSLNVVNDGAIPMLGGTGDFKIRVSTRSKFYEIQAEIKIREFTPPTSRFSVLDGSSKINPFSGLNGTGVLRESLLLEQKMIEKVGGWIKSFPGKAKEFFYDLKQEAEESAAVGMNLAKVFHGYEMNSAEVNFVKDQIADIGKGTVVAAAALAPGGSLLVPFLMKAAGKLGIDLVPSSFKNKENIEEAIIREHVRTLLQQAGSIYVGGVLADVDIANTPSTRQTGLMHRDAIDRGMLFCFPDCRRRSFWMKNTHVPLSIAYADEAGVIINIEDLQPDSLEGVRSSEPATYALEMNKGWFEKNGIRPGDKIEGYNVRKSRS